MALVKFMVRETMEKQYSVRNIVDDCSQCCSLILVDAFFLKKTFKRVFARVHNTWPKVIVLLLKQFDF